MRKLTLMAAALALGMGSACVAADPVLAAIAAAVADTARPEADTARDAARKPAEIVAFAGVKAGDVVAEMIPGGGYYTRILSRTVGPEGHVYLLVPAAFAQRPGGLDGLNTLASAYGNVTVMPVDLTSFTLPVAVDLVWTTENYHDMHNGPTANPAGVNDSAFAALKPGGIYFVEDHSAPGAGTTVTQTLHRIDPKSVISEVTESGFQFEEQSDLLANPNDPHDVGVRDPSVQGETDKFAIRFRKPG
ncbi:MAG: methyltransferase [Croceibacterium sp.]